MMSCYYPTTTIAIDDDADFLEMLTKHLGITDCIPHLSPKKAIASLNNDKAFQRIQARIFKPTTTPGDISSFPEDYAVLVRSRGIHEEIYNIDRFHDVSVTYLYKFCKKHKRAV